MKQRTKYALGATAAGLAVTAVLSAVLYGWVWLMLVAPGATVLGSIATGLAVTFYCIGADMYDDKS